MSKTLHDILAEIEGLACIDADDGALALAALSDIRNRIAQEKRATLTGVSLGAALETGYAHALDVVAKWSAGDLAGAVNGLEEWAEALPEQFPDLEFTPFEGDDGDADE